MDINREQDRSTAILKETDLKLNEHLNKAIYDIQDHLNQL